MIAFDDLGDRFIKSFFSTEYDIIFTNIRSKTHFIGSSTRRKTPATTPRITCTSYWSVNQMSSIGNGNEGDRSSIKSTSSLSCSWFSLLSTSFIFTFLFFMIVFATWFVKEVCDFGLGHLSFVLGCLSCNKTTNKYTE